MAEVDRYCRNCGHELSPEDRFCPNCGRPAHETAHVPTPEADVSVPPPSPPGVWRRFKEGWQGTGQPGTRFTDPPPPRPGSEQHQPGVWTGVKLGCGMFIVLPLLLLGGCAACAAILGAAS